MPERTQRLRVIAALVLCLALALGGQAFADAQVPEASGADTGRAVGQAANSYLTGIRTYIAAVLWNRVDPLMHNYYGTVPLDDQRYMLSTIAAVQMLDPHAVDSFYVGAWLLARNDRTADAITMAERGVAENPNEGILISNLAQVISLYGDDPEYAAEVGERALASDVYWRDLNEAHTALVVLGDVFRLAGRQDLFEEAMDEVERIDAEAGDQIPAGQHDHDGDGIQDH